MPKEKQKKIMCDKCGQERKPTLFMPAKGGKRKGHACDCGFFDKSGVLIYEYK